MAISFIAIFFKKFFCLALEQLEEALEVLSAKWQRWKFVRFLSVSYTHLRAHETEADLVCRLLLEKKKK